MEEGNGYINGGHGVGLLSSGDKGSDGCPFYKTKSSSPIKSDGLVILLLINVWCWCKTNDLWDIVTCI